MRRVIDVLSILGLIAAPVSLGLAYSHTITPQSNTLSTKISQKFPLNQPKIVEFQTDLAGFKQFSNRQQLDQLRDWLLLTVLHNQELSTKEINQATYDLPTVRYGFMQPVSNFEYGETRSLYVGKGRVIVLVPKASSQAKRRDDLAQIADRHRKDLGKQPTSLVVFEYEIQPDKQSAFLIQRGVLDNRKLFSSEYGYHEASIKSLEELRLFMTQIDDIVSCKMQDDALLLSGRKIHAHPYKRTTVEDIAAIWQSEEKIQTQMAAFRTRWEQKISALPEFQQDQAITQAREERQKLRLVNGSGFSLDPAYDYTQLQVIFFRVKPVLQFLANGSNEAITRQDIQQAEQSLAKRQEVPFLILLDKLAKSSNPRSKIFAKLVNSAAESTRFQAARYDGDLQGTEVGMVLFYTDLLAKLWALNYIDSTPSQVIPNLIPLTKVKISSIYKNEIEALPNTRLWFGPQDRGYQMANEGNSLLFARNATRIYAASSNPLKPGIETAAAANTDTFLSWWNDHYEEVARHEPQYERLNQIMKWSLVISWLNQSNHSQLLDFLQTVPVKRNNLFPNWAKAQGNHLKFQQWKQIGFFKPGYKGSKTEAMPLLESESYQSFGQSGFYRGGVSLGSKGIFEGRPALGLADDLADLSQRSNLKYDSIARNPEKLSFQTFGETTFSLKNFDSTLGTATAQAKVGTKFRSPDAELRNQVFSRNVSQTNSGLKIDTSIDDIEFGTFRTNENRNGFVAGFSSRDMDRGYSLAHHLSTARGSIEVVLKESPDVESVFKSSTNPSEFIVRLSSSKRWLKITGEEPKGSVGGGGSQPPKPPDDWKMIVGNLGGNSRHIRLAWVDDLTVQKQLKTKELQLIYTTTKDTSKDKFGFAKDWDDLKYQEVAEKLPDNYPVFLKFKQEHLKINLNKVDRFLKAKNDDKASRILAQLIDQYGPAPELIFRRAVINIRQGKLNVKQILPKGSTDKNNFFDVVNGLLVRGKFRISRIETGKAFIYAQDDPRLNNVDWNVPFDKSIPSGSGARVYQVLPGDVGKVKLHLSGLGDSSSSFHSSTQFQNEDGKYVSGMTTSLRATATNNSDDCNIASDNDKNNREYYDEKCLSEKQNLEKPVYIVIIPK